MSTVTDIDIGNLDNCIDDIRQAMQSNEQPPSFNIYAKNYRRLLTDLQKAIPSLPKVYQDSIGNPFLQYLKKIGEGQFNHYFTARYPTREDEFYQSVISDVSLALLLHSQNFEPKASHAFQELVSDLYDSFLSEEDRAGNASGTPINPPDYEILPPLVKWGNPDQGPYTWPVDGTTAVGAKTAVVNLPQYFTRQGLLAWSSLGHETGGHDILHADKGLLDEITAKVRTAVASKCGIQMGNLWGSWVDEASSDVLGLLHLGPAAGIGLIGFFRGLNDDGRLRSVGGITDPHPIDVLRGFLAAELVRNLNFKDAAVWGNVIEQESLKDLGKSVYLYNAKTKQYTPIDAKIAVQSAKIAALTIANSKLKALENHSLHDIQDWTDNDQKIADEIAIALRETGKLPPAYGGQAFYAAHVVSAATTEALKAGADIQKVFDRMLQFLDEMHAGNTAWQPSHIMGRRIVHSRFARAS